MRPSFKKSTACLKTLALIWIILPFFAYSESSDNWKTPEYIAKEKTSLMYEYYLQTFMRTPEINPHNLAFRIENNIKQGAKGDNLEFHLMAVLHRDWVNITYPKGKSIYNQMHEYFLRNPTVGFDNFKFQPEFIKKKVSYSECPKLKDPIYKMEQYIKTSLMSDISHEFSDYTYTLGYTNFYFDIQYQNNNNKESPFKELIGIKKIAEKCAQKLPTIEEKIKLEEIERRKNYKGKIFDHPPYIILHAEEKDYESTIGTFCWPIDTVEFCSDSFANITNKTPIILKSSDVLSFEIPEEQELDYIEYAIAKVRPSDISKDIENQDDFYAWDKKLKFTKTSLKNLKSIPLDGKRGEYIIILFGQWRLYGDAVHGFYIKVEK